MKNSAGVGMKVIGATVAAAEPGGSEAPSVFRWKRLWW